MSGPPRARGDVRRILGAPMPADQRGSVYATKKGYGIQYTDETGQRKRESGFKSRSDARSWFENIERRRMRGEIIAPSPMTLAELVDEYLDAARRGGEHDPGAPRPAQARDRRDPGEAAAKEREHGLGEIRVDRLDARTVGAWRKRLPEGSAWHAHKALRQVLGYAVRAKLASENVAQVGAEPGAEAPRGPTFGRGQEIETSRTNSARARAPSRSSSPAPDYGPRSGSRSSGATSTSRAASSTSGASTPTAASRSTGSRNGRSGASRSAERAVDALQAPSVAARHTARLSRRRRRATWTSHDWRRNEWYPALDAAGVCEARPLRDAAHVRVVRDRRRRQLCSTSPGSWDRASSRSTGPTGTCCPTPRNTGAASSTTYDVEVLRPSKRIVLHAKCTDGKRPEGRKPLVHRIGAPRFELGTSSPPD